MSTIVTVSVKRPTPDTRCSKDAGTEKPGKFKCYFPKLVMVKTFPIAKDVYQLKGKLH